MGTSQAVRAKPRPAPRKRAPVGEVHAVANITGWRAGLVVALGSGHSVHRSASASLEIICELPEGWKPQLLLLYVSQERIGASMDCDVIAVLGGSKDAWSITWALTPEEYSHVLTSVTGAEAHQLSITCTKPRYRLAHVYSLYLEASSGTGALSLPNEI